MEELHRTPVPPTAEELRLLGGTFLLSGLTEEEAIRALAAVSPTVCAYGAGASVVEAGHQFSAIGILTTGELSVLRSGEHRRVVHRTLRAGEIFGVSSLFGGEDGFPTTVVAAADSRVLFLSEEDVRAMATAVPKVAFNYIAILTDKIRFLNRRLDTLAGRSAEERVAEHLVHGIGENGSLGTTKSALASLLGLGRASLYRILDLFEKKGWILTHRDRIEILDAAAIKSFINDRKETKK